jgi:phospholipid/cholesterol/gamma-HCH transport system substrate-binding protein
MAKMRMEFKVGLFVFISLTLLAILMIQFSRGTTFFRDTYELRLRAVTAGGIKTRAAVMLSGVQVGYVSAIRLSADGRSVTIFARIYGDYVIRADARFVIEQSGFLGDQYIAIIPTQRSDAPELKHEDVVTVQEPFNMQEVARSAAGFIQRVDEAAKKLNDAIADVRRLVLNEETLTNLSVTVGNMRVVSERALHTVESINSLVETNSPAIGDSLSNLVFFSEQVVGFADNFGGMLTTNSAELTAAMKNVESSTVVLKTLIDDVEAGKGLAGQILRNDMLASNITAIASNLAITSSNLNRRGLWGIMWSRRERDEPQAQAPPPVLESPNDPFR